MRGGRAIRLNLDAEEFAALKHWCVDTHTTMAATFSLYARALIHGRITQSESTPATLLWRCSNCSKPFTPLEVSKMLEEI